MKANALISRYHGLLAKNGCLVIDEITIDPARHIVSVDGKTINLAPKEYDLLLMFIDHKDLVLTRDQILDNAWNSDFEESRLSHRDSDQDRICLEERKEVDCPPDTPWIRGF